MRPVRRRYTLVPRNKERPAMTRILKKILIAVDDTPASLTAVEQGLALAADDDAEVVFLHVGRVPGETVLRGQERAERGRGGPRKKFLVRRPRVGDPGGVVFPTGCLDGYPPAQIALLA